MINEHNLNYLSLINHTPISMYEICFNIISRIMKIVSKYFKAIGRNL